MSENGEEVKPKVKKPEKQLRFFISNLRSTVGHELVKTLRNDTNPNVQNPHLILGSCPEDVEFQQFNLKDSVPEGVKKVIDTTKLNFLTKILQDSDVIIYDLHNCSLKEAEYAIKTLKMSDYEEDKFLIFISSVMTWSNTPPKEKKETEEAEEDNPDFQEEPDTEVETPEGQQQAGGDDQEPEQKKVYTRFNEKDYPLRKPLPKYEKLKSLETMCMSASQSKKNLKSYVLCSGVLYGCGEDVFYEYCKQAWLQNPPSLSYYGEGKNRIPSIHVSDLVMFVKRIIEKPPKKTQYIFAIDYNKKSTQKSIIQAISKGIGTGKTHSVPIPQNYLEMQNYLDIFLLNVRMTPSRAFDEVLGEGEEEQQQQEQEEEEADENAKPKYVWKCKEGIQSKIAVINQEFNTYNSLKPNRIFITGPPASGKTFFGKQLAQHYNIPHITIKEVYEMAIKEESEFGEEVKTALEGEKARLIEEAEEKLAKIKEKKEKQGLPITEEDEKVDESKIYPRIPDDLLYKAFTQRLMQNDCQNRGFVLDGYPRSYENAKGLFLTLPPPAEGQEETPEDVEKIINNKVITQAVICLESQDSFLQNNLKQLPEKQIQGTHFNSEDMQRRLKLYRNLNETESGKPNVLNFFQENNIDVLNIELENQKSDIFKSMLSFIERREKYKNYQTAVQKQEEERFQQEKQHQQEILQRIEQQKQERDQKENEIRNQVEEEYKLTMEDLKNKENQVLDFKSKPLREYLNDNVLPFVKDGLIKILQQKPNDPVDFLAEFLFQQNLNVSFPDPRDYLKNKEIQEKQKQQKQ